MRKGITFLIFSLLFVSSTVALSDEEQTFLDEVNDARAKYANDYNLPNMHKLVWSQDLVAILEPLNYKDEWTDARITWRFAPMLAYANITSDIEETRAEFLTRTEANKKAVEGKHARRLELLNPLQTVIGCNYKLDGVKNIVVCLLGPEGELFWDFETKSTEMPGSACLPHYENEDGLCVPVNSAEVSYFGFSQDFVDGINEKRRSFAKLYHIPNMHELIWNQDLVDIAVTLNWVDNQPQAGQTWRY